MKKFNLESQAGLAISKIKDTIPKIMELDSMLTKISKTSRLAEKELKQLGTESYLAKTQVTIYPASSACPSQASMARPEWGWQSSRCLHSPLAAWSRK